MTAKHIPYKIYLSEEEMPKAWYNVKAHMKTQHPPFVNPATQKPCTASDLSPVFCDECIGVYIARDLIPSKQHLDEDECIEVEEWDVKDLLKLIYSGKMTDGKTVAAILAYAQREGIRL